MHAHRPVELRQEVDRAGGIDLERCVLEAELAREVERRFAHLARSGVVARNEVNRLRLGGAQHGEDAFRVGGVRRRRLEDVARLPLVHLARRPGGVQQHATSALGLG